MIKRIVLLLLLLPTLSFSQGIGDRYFDVNRLLSDKSNGFFNIKYSNEGETYNNISAENDFAGYIYFFPKEGDWRLRCALIALIPKSRESVFGFIKYLNNEYIVIDDKNWDFYRQDGYIVRVELKSVDNALVFYYYPKQAYK